jgi:hypothetical protein
MTSVSFDDFRPISMCNCIYKIISLRVKKLLSKSTSSEKFRFLCARKMHDAIGGAQEGMPNKTKEVNNHGVEIGSLKSTWSGNLFEAYVDSSWFLCSFCKLDNELFDLNVFCSLNQWFRFKFLDTQEVSSRDSP